MEQVGAEWPHVTPLSLASQPGHDWFCSQERGSGDWESRLKTFSPLEMESDLEPGPDVTSLAFHFIRLRTGYMYFFQMFASAVHDPENRNLSPY
jgi:hypothetical protein